MDGKCGDDVQRHCPKECVQALYASHLLPPAERRNCSGETRGGPEVDQKCPGLR